MKGEALDNKVKKERERGRGEGGLEVGCLLQKRDHKLSVYLHQLQLNSCAQAEQGLHNSARWASPHLQIIMANGTKYTEERNEKKQRTKEIRSHCAGFICIVAILKQPHAHKTQKQWIKLCGCYTKNLLYLPSMWCIGIPFVLVLRRIH